MLELTIILLFATILLLVLGFFYSSPQRTVKRRLDTMVTTSPDRTVAEELQIPFFQRVFAPLGDGVARLLKNYTPLEFTQRTQKRLLMANMDARWTPNQFQGFCWLGGAGGMILMLAMMYNDSSVRNPDHSINIATAATYLLVGAAAGYILPQFALSRRIRQRQEQILASLPYSLDLLTITVEAGLGFDAALAYAMRKMKGPLMEEFAKTLNEIRLGKPRLDALEDLGARTGVEDLKLFITAVVHASRLGASITTTLRVQADALRTRRRQRVQELAMKAPVKMTFPLVFLIFPALFVVVLGPGFLSVMKLLR
ncbi:MAG: type II secretion system F family protein [Verrucomicrobia bacterium]|nr:type II secretion system F family protein [Verrucomicrobiota bacterium]